MHTALGLINIHAVDNDFHQNESIYRLFDGLEVQGMDERFEDKLVAA